MSSHPSNVVIIANRGPNDFVWDGSAWVTKTAAGGLVSMLTPLARQANVSWFCCVSEPPDAADERPGLYTTAMDQTDPRLHVRPVPIPAALYHGYYGQVSNEVLWMLQHQIIGPGGYEYLDLAHHQAWDAYLQANQQMVRSVAAARPAVSAFLVQDYHLYVLPALLRAAYPQTPILHFTHVPFPDAGTLKLLPREWREQILRGLLGADIVGLQTTEDCDTFLTDCARLLGCEVNPADGVVQLDAGRSVRVRAYPASVDPRALRRSMRSHAVQEARARLAGSDQDLTLIRVDRLDPSKNQLVGFRAFGRLLEIRPDLRRRARFLAFLVPSRTDLNIYRAYRDAVYQAIQEINDRFQAECGRPPIEVFYTNDREQALAAMEMCDVLLVNSVKDGMNLVAKEWAVVSRRPGVLIVSETAGVAPEALDAALQVSPLDLEGTAVALRQAMDMPAAERRARLGRFRRRVVEWTAADWLRAQMIDLGLSAPSAT